MSIIQERMLRNSKCAPSKSLKAGFTQSIIQKNTACSVGGMSEKGHRMKLPTETRFVLKLGLTNSWD
jgi:hypothetical protein